MKSDRHILVLSPGFPQDEADDVCMPYFQDFLKLFAEKAPSLRFTVIAFQYPYQARHYRLNGTEVHALGGKNKRWYKPILWRLAKRKIQEIHTRQPVDAILSLWLAETAMVGEQFARKTSIRHVAVAMGQDVLAENAYLKRLELGNTPIVALSPHAAATLEKNRGWKTAAIIPFAEPTSSFDFTLPRPEKDIDILGVGGLTPLKRYDRFLEVVAILSKNYPGLRAVLIGDGDERTKLKAKAKELNILQNLEFLGLQSRKSTLECMQRAKVLLHTSAHEGQGYVFTEALNRGLYVVSTACGIAQESEDWAVCEEPEQLAEAVEAFWLRPAADLKQRKESHSKAQTRMVEGYLSLLEGGNGTL